MESIKRSLSCDGALSGQTACQLFSLRALKTWRAPVLCTLVPPSQCHRLSHCYAHAPFANRLLNAFTRSWPILTAPLGSPLQTILLELGGPSPPGLPTKATLILSNLLRLYNLEKLSLSCKKYWTIPVLKLLQCVALERLTNSKCKPGQGHRALLKLDSRCDVIKYRFLSSVVKRTGYRCERFWIRFSAG